MRKEIQRLDKELKDVDASAGQFQRNVGNYPKVLEKGLNSIKGFAAALAALGGAAIGAKSAMQSTEEGSEELREGMSKLEGATKAASNTIGVTLNETFDLVQHLWNDTGSPEELDAALNKISDSFSELGDNASKQADAYADAEKKQITLEKQTNLYRTTVAALTAEFEKQNQLAGDDTLGMDSINTATEKAQELSIQITKFRKKELEAELEILKVKKESATEGANNLALDTAISEKRAQITEEEGRQVVESMALEQIKQKNKRDIYEKDLDFAIDAFDTQKTINERQLAEEGKTVEQRRKLLDETIVLSENAFEDQKKLTNDYLTEQGKSAINFDKLLEQTEEKRVREMVKAVTMDEIVLQRVLETWRERKIVVQDLKEEEAAYWETYIENVELQLEVERKRQRNAGTLAEFEKKAALDRLAVIKEEQALYEENSNRFLELESEKLDLMQKLQKESAEKQKEMIDAFNDYVNDQFQKSNEKRVAEIDKEADAIESRIQTIRTAAEAGNEDARQSLAELEAQQARLAKKRESQRKRELVQESVLSGIQLLGANADEPNALGKTISDYTALVSIISSLSAFNEGTELVGRDLKESPLLKGKQNDRHIVRVDGSERILTGDQNKMLGNLSNDEVAKLGQMHRMGELTGGVVGVTNNENLEKEVKAMRQSIDNLHKQIPIQRVDYDAKTKEYVHVIQSNNKTEKLRTKASKLWH